MPANGPLQLPKRVGMIDFFAFERCLPATVLPSHPPRRRRLFRSSLLFSIRSIVMEYQTQPQPNWKDRFTTDELRLIANARRYAENDPAGLRSYR